MIEGLLVRGTGTSEAQALALPQALLAAPWADAGWLHAIDATSPRPQLWSKLAVSAVVRLHPLTGSPLPFNCYLRLEARCDVYVTSMSSISAAAQFGHVAAIKQLIALQHEHAVLSISRQKVRPHRIGP